VERLKTAKDTWPDQLPFAGLVRELFPLAEQLKPACHELLKDARLPMPVAATARGAVVSLTNFLHATPRDREDELDLASSVIATN
jgi:hypothetical protein